MSKPEHPLEVTALSVRYPAARRGEPPVTAVADVSFSLAARSVLAIVGESGCGKSTLGRALVQLTRPATGTIRASGTLLSEGWRTRMGHDVWVPPKNAVGLRPQMVFQDTLSALDPTQSAGAALEEALLLRGAGPRAARRAQAATLLQEVGLPEGAAHQRPHSLSGGQRQRVGIARALAAEPRVLVADEPTSALDVSVKGHVLMLFTRLVQSRGLSLIFITHDLTAAAVTSDEIMVLYAGRVMEWGPTAAVLNTPGHPYTQALLRAAPRARPNLERARLHALSAQAPLEQAATTGCPYRLRCPLAVALCEAQRPVPLQLAGRHRVACHRAFEQSDKRL